VQVGVLADVDREVGDGLVEVLLAGAGVGLVDEDLDGATEFDAAGLGVVGLGGVDAGVGEGGFGDVRVRRAEKFIGVGLRVVDDAESRGGDPRGQSIDDLLRGLLRRGFLGRGLLERAVRLGRRPSGCGGRGAVLACRSLGRRRLARGRAGDGRDQEQECEERRCRRTITS
jgi:hypothetical protein